MISGEQNREIDVLLAEYQAVRSELLEFERILFNSASLYLTVLVIMVGWIAASMVKKELTSKEFVNNQMVGYLLPIVCAINSLIGTLGATYSYSIFVRASYIDNVIKCRLDGILKHPVLFWDLAHGENGIARFLENTTAIVWLFVSLAISILILVVTPYYWKVFGNPPDWFLRVEYYVAVIATGVYVACLIITFVGFLS